MSNPCCMLLSPFSLLSFHLLHVFMILMLILILNSYGEFKNTTNEWSYYLENRKGANVYIIHGIVFNFLSLKFYLFYFLIPDEMDECVSGTDLCSKFAKCEDTIESYTCECDYGYFGDGYTCNGMFFIII